MARDHVGTRRKTYSPREHELPERPKTTHGYLDAGVDRRERTLEHRRNVRKGVEAPRPPEKTRIIRLRLEDCYYCRGRGFNCSVCDGKGRVLVPTLRGRVGALRLPEGWAA